MPEKLTLDMLPEQMQPFTDDRILTCMDCRYHPSLGPLWFRCGFDNKHTHPDTIACGRFDGEPRPIVDELADAVRWLTGAAWHHYDWTPGQIEAGHRKRERRNLETTYRIQARYREECTRLLPGQVNL